VPRHWLAAAGLVLITLAAYAPVRRAGFVWDDDAHVTENLPLRSLSGLGDVWLHPRATPQYYPLVHTTFWVEHRLWGPRPLGYHLVNVLLHAANALLLWRLLRRLAVPGAFWAAALFAVHPVHVESVAWITERKNLLSTLGYLGSALALLRFWPPEEAGPRPAGRWTAYGLALLLFAAALLSKTVACTLPAAFLLVRWWKQGRVTFRDVLVSAPLFALGLALGLQTVFLEKEHVGARGAEWDLSAVERALIAGRAVWFYAGKLVWPTDLMFIYPRWEVRADSWWQYGFPLAALAVLLGLYALRRQLGRGPLAVALFFCGTLVPALGFFDVYPMRYSFVADHFQYLASAGLLALLAATAARALSGRRPAARYAAGAAGALLVGLLGALAWRQAAGYRDAVTLWTDTLGKNPDCWMAYNNRGRAYLRSGDARRALADCTRAIEVKPDLPEAHSNRGLAHLRLGQLPQALADCTRAIELKPDLVTPYSTRGEVYLQLGQLRQALADCTRAVELSPGQAETHNNRGLVYLRLGQAEEAVNDFTRALQLSPELAGAYLNRGDVYLLQGRLREALLDYDRAVGLGPEVAGAYANRGMAYLLQGLYDRAAQDFARALALQPGSAKVYFNRALLHFALKEYPEAWGDVQRGEELGGTPNPKFLRALSEASGRAK
jgi:tetratricopeptide (TPR) repeat protein